MGRPLFYEIIDKPTTSFVIALCSLVWFYIQKNGVGYSHVGMSYQAARQRTLLEDRHVGLLSHQQHLAPRVQHEHPLDPWYCRKAWAFGLSVKFYLEYTLVLVLLSGVIVLGMYHLVISRFKVEYFRRVPAVGYSCVVLGWNDDPLC